MTKTEAIKMLTARVECIKRWYNGNDENCNAPDCGECVLWYEQGNMLEQIEYLQMAIKTLETQPKTGKWLLNGDRLCECSVCHHEGNEYGDAHFCAYCGTRMEGNAE